MYLNTQPEPRVRHQDTLSRLTTQIKVFVNSNFNLDAVVELCEASEEPESKCMGGGTKDQRRTEATGRKWFKNKLPVVGENTMTVGNDHNIFFITQYCTQKPGGEANVKCEG